MWTCIQCGCRAIARDLGFCPQCFKVREDDVPKTTSGGPSNAWEDPEPETQPEVPAPAESAQGPAGDAGKAADSVKVERRYVPKADKD